MRRLLVISSMVLVIILAASFQCLAGEKGKGPQKQQFSPLGWYNGDGQFLGFCADYYGVEVLDPELGRTYKINIDLAVPILWDMEYTDYLMYTDEDCADGPYVDHWPIRVLYIGNVF